MLVLLLEGNKCTVLDLCSLNGGTLAEFLQFLQEKCPALEGKPVRHRNSLFWANWGILICAGICLVCSLIPGPAFQPRMMTVEESAAILEELEIPVGQVHIDMMLEDQQKYDLPERADWIPNLLFYAGFDFYDENLNDTPKTPGIYSFDIEAWDVGNMYTKFLNGLSEASEGALVFEDIVEDESFENLENGTGSKTISFTFRGERYTVEARMLADWMDTKALTEIAKVVNSSGKEKQLWFFSADGQVISVFYRDKAWANQFMRLTGHRLTNDLRWMLMG